jgi:hypothetical protein
MANIAMTTTTLQLGNQPFCLSLLFPNSGFMVVPNPSFAPAVLPLRFMSEFVVSSGGVTVLRVEMDAVLEDELGRSGSVEVSQS